MAANKNLDIIPECYVDTNLISYLLHGEVNHKYGCNQVANLLQKSDSFGVGIIDDDKRKHNYVSEFQPVAKMRNLELLKHPRKPQYFIIVKKAVEDFILSVARNNNLDLSEIEMPTDLESLKEYTKNCQANKDPRLQEVFKLLKDTPEILALKQALRYLVEKKYNADINKLKTIFNN